ncbi:MAG: metal ABC transporter permease, partial [Candidatus Andersenbacteria bacterium]
MLELLAQPFFQRALIVGLILGILMALLGVLVVLRRLSFFADAIGHSALTGIALGLLLQFNPFITALLFAVAVAAGITLVKRFSKLPIDTLLGIAFPAAVAVGVILVRLTPG